MLSDDVGLRPGDDLEDGDKAQGTGGEGSDETEKGAEGNGDRVATAIIVAAVAAVRTTGSGGRADATGRKGRLLTVCASSRGRGLVAGLDIGVDSRVSTKVAARRSAVRQVIVGAVHIGELVDGSAARKFTVLASGAIGCNGIARATGRAQHSASLVELVADDGRGEVWLRKAAPGSVYQARALLRVGRPRQVGRRKLVRVGRAGRGLARGRRHGGRESNPIVLVGKSRKVGIGRNGAVSIGEVGRQSEALAVEKVFKRESARPNAEHLRAKDDFHFGPRARPRVEAAKLAKVGDDGVRFKVGIEVIVRRNGRGTAARVRVEAENVNLCRFVAACKIVGELGTPSSAVRGRIADEHVRAL